MKTRLSRFKPISVIVRANTVVGLWPLTRLMEAGIVGIGVLTATAALAQTPDIWNGGAVSGGNSFWNAAANWNNAAPTATTPLVFDGTTGLLSTNNLTTTSPGFSVPSVTFNSTAGSFYFYGNGFPLVMSNSAPGTIVGITNNSTSAAQWFGTNFGLSLSNSINVYDAGGGIVLSNPVAGNAAGAINGMGGITNVGPGTLVLGSDAGWSLFSGGVTVNSGTVYVYGNGGSSGAGSGVATVNAGGTLVGSSGDAFGYTSGKYPTNIVINGGTVSDLGTSSYEITMPNISFTGGTLTSAAGNAGSGSFTFNAFGNGTVCNISSIGTTTTAIINTAGLGIERAINFNVAAGSVTGGAYPGVDMFVSSYIAKSGTHSPQTVSKNGTGVLEFAGANNFSTGINISNGVLVVGAAQATGSGPLGNSSDVISMAGGTLRYSPANNYDYSGMFSSAAGANLLNIDVAGQSVTYAHALTSSGGTLTLSDSVGGGALTLSAADTYTGPTTINGGTLLVNNSLGSSSSVTIGSGALAGSGTVNGTVTTTASSKGINQEVYDTLNSAVGTLTLNGNANMNAGGAVYLDLGTTHVSGNDQILMGAGALLTLNNTTFHINALSGSANLDAAGNYVLVQGSSSGISGTVNATPAWDGTAPGNSGQYIVEILGNNVVLHNNFYVGLAITGSTSTPSSANRFQSSVLRVTVTNGTPPYTVTVDASSIGDGTVTLYTNSATGIYTFTNSFVPSAGTALGTYSLPVSAGDNAHGSANANISFTVVGAPLVWNGDAGGNSFWDTTDPEWQAGLATLTNFLNGDFVRFDNTATGLDATNVDLLASISPSGIVVSNTAGLATGTYTINGTNDSGGGDNIGGSGGVVKQGSGTLLMLEGSDSFTGGILVEGGTLIYSNVQGTAAISGGITLTNNSSMVLDQFGTVAGGVLIGSGSTLQLGNNDAYNQAPGGPWTLNGTVEIDSTANLSLGSVAIGGASTGDFVLDNSNTVTLGGANTFSGDILLNAGTLAFSGADGTGAQGSLGNSTAGGRTVTINTNATLSGTINNWFGGTSLADADFPAIIINGGTNATTRYTAIGSITLNNGAVLISSGGPESQPSSYQAYQFRGSVTVGGSSPSTMINTTGKANHLGSNTVFNVAVTSGSGPDLTVTTPFWNQSGDYGGAVGGLTKTGLGTMLLLDTINTYTGNTFVSAGTLSLAGTTSISNSAAFIIAGGSTFDVSGLASPFALASSQTLSNSTSTAILNCGAGGASAGSGSLSLTYASGTPSLLVTNGTLTLSGSTPFNINNTGAALGAGTYTIISDAMTGNVGLVSGTAPSSVTVGGGGIVGGATASLQISGGVLNLVVVSSASPAIFTHISVNGSTLNINATNGAVGGQYVLLESTNLLLPVNQWTPVLTNTFNGSGDINLSTNIINANNPQEFYLLQMP